MISIFHIHQDSPSFTKCKLILPIISNSITTDTPYLCAVTEGTLKYFNETIVTCASKNGPKNAVIFPEKAKNPKNSFSLSLGQSFDISDLLDD